MAVKKPHKIGQVMDELNEGEKKLKNYTVFILDRSSSMQSFGPEAIDAFNQQVRATKKALVDKPNIETQVSLLTFASEVDKPEIWCRPLDEIQELGEKDYQPGGMTALHDAIGWAITELQKQKDIKEDTTSVLFVIVSDGAENNSRTWRGKIGNMIKEMEATKRWTFAYEGASADLAESAVADMQISCSNSMNLGGNSAVQLRASNRSRYAKSMTYFDSMSAGQMQSQNYHQVDSDTDTPEITWTSTTADDTGQSGS